MVNMTLSIPTPLYKEMKRHKEIRWSEAARKGILRELLQIKKEIHGKDLIKMFTKETQENIEALKKLPKEDWEQWIKKGREKDQKRIHY